MTRLAIGVLLWSVVHFMPAILTDLKKHMVSRFGENPYKGIFALIMAVAIYLIISGWKSAATDVVYTVPDWGVYAAFLLVLLGFILFFAPYPPNNIKRMMRHPQLIGTACWGVGHLFAIGDTRSIVLFGGLAAWALIEMLLLNRRDGEWVKPASVPGKNDLTMVLFSVLVFMVVLYTHHLIFGGSPLT
jgi:uncharacterized membrane protein